MYDLSHFELSDMTRCGAGLRKAGAGAESMEDAAQVIVRQLYEQLTDGTGATGCALVRLFVTLEFGRLDETLRSFGRTLMKAQALDDKTRCLTLLATAGDESQWNARQESIGHKTIPLPSEQVVSQIPMISQLIHQLGLEVAAVLRPDPDFLLELGQRSYNVFYVPRAEGSPFIPRQDFVTRYGIRSVLGIGGIFPTGDMFAVMMFTKVEVPRDTADMFRTAALNVKLALLPFANGPILSTRG